MRRFVLAALLAAGVFAPPAAAQIPPPSIVTDTRFAFQGVSEYDQAVGSSDVAVAAALDPARDRSYAIGTTQDGSAASQIAIVARRGDGSLDTGFAGDGSLALSVTDGKTAGGFDMLVLPDGRLRVLGRTDVSTGGTPDFDTVIAGLRPDGTPDTDFGDEGFEVFPAGSGDDEPFTIVAGPGGKLATTGSTGTDTFLAVRNADGSEVAPVKVLDRSPGRFDGGSDVAWNGDAPVVVIDAASATGMQVFLHEFRPGGFETEVVVPGADSLLGTGLLAYGGKLWTTGIAHLPGGDDDAYLARAGGDGGGLEVRRFDLRGASFPAPQPVDSAGFDLTVAPGDPDTLIVGGRATTDAGAEWAFAAYNGLDGPLAALRSADLVIPIAGSGGAFGVAAGPGGVVSAAGTVTDANGDSSIGMARVRIDAEKRCDLSLTIVSPVELTMRGLTPGSVTVRITNSGSRACDGTVKIPAPWAPVSGDVTTGRLLPGDTITRSYGLTYVAAFPATATLELSLESAADAALGDNVSRVRAEFLFCDLALSVLDAPPVLGTEGSRRFSFSLRNVGTAPCKGSQIVAGAQARLTAVPSPFGVAAGRSVEDAFDVSVLKGSKSGRNASLAFQALDAEEGDRDHAVKAERVMVHLQVFEADHALGQVEAHGGFSRKDGR